GASSPSLCASVSEEILKAVKRLNFDCYKYVVSVLIVEKADTWVSAKCETKTFIALALVMACYYE
ncbi:TC1D3 protein, partial [Crotophaga sulcirostris]|nr:TC1D3 protein [Crotophaga sulcirostris]